MTVIETSLRSYGNLKTVYDVTYLTAVKPHNITLYTVFMTEW